MVAGLAVGLVTLGAALDGQPLVAVLLGPRLALLRRQPIGGPSFGLAAVLALLPVTLPIAALAGVWTAARPAPIALWTALGLVPALAAGSRRWVWAAAGSALAGVAAGSIHGLTGPGPWIAAALAWAAVTPLAGSCALWWADHGPSASRGHKLGEVAGAAARRAIAGMDGSGAAWSPPALRPRTALAALVHRDLLALWRTQRHLVAGTVASAPVVGGIAALMHRVGDWAGPALTAGVLVLLVAVGPAALAAVGAVARHLGRRLDPPEWPVSSAQRALALALVGGLALAPSWAAAAVVAPPIGLGHVRIAGFVAAIGLGAAWWVAARPSRPNPGTWPYWLGACLAAALAPGGLLWVGLLAGIALHGAARALESARSSPPGSNGKRR